MEFNIVTPLTLVLTSLFFSIKQGKKLDRVFLLLVVHPFLMNTLIYLCEKGFSLDDITQQEVYSFFYSSFITIISAMVIYLIYLLLKRLNQRV